MKEVGKKKTQGCKRHIAGSQSFQLEPTYSVFEKGGFFFSSALNLLPDCNPLF